MATTLDQRPQPGLVQEVAAETIPSDLEPLVDQYAAVTDDRDDLLWKWLWHVFPAFRLSAVPRTHAADARRAKFCFSMYMTVLDDLSERHGDRATFEAGRAIALEDNTVEPAGQEVDDDVLALLRRVWDETERHFDAGPRADRFRELFTFDLRQSLNTMDYNRLVNDGPQLANTAGIERYDTHNMLLFLYVDIDLAFAPDFDTAELGALRDVTWDAQKLARIGNWITTWERELMEDDYTSKVVVEALERGVITREELQSRSVPNDVLIRRIKETSIEHDLLLNWNDIYGRLTATKHDLVSVDIEDFLDGIRYLLEVDVKMRGRK